MKDNAGDAEKEADTEVPAEKKPRQPRKPRRRQRGAHSGEAEGGAVEPSSGDSPNDEERPLGGKDGNVL